MRLDVAITNEYSIGIALCYVPIYNLRFSPKYCTYRGHEGGDCTNILPPMGGIVYKCNTVKLFHSPGVGRPWFQLTGAL